MNRLALIPLVAIMLTVAGCSASQPAADPQATCVDVSTEYGLADDEAEAADFCVWLKEHETLLGGSTFEETFGDSASAREWAEAESAKSN